MLVLGTGFMMWKNLVNSEREEGAMPLLLEPLAVMLHWLWLYPLCEVQELASASQVSESTVYRLLAELMRLDWVDTVRHAGLLDASRSQHYVLTSPGCEQLVLAHQTKGRMQVAASDEMGMKAPSSSYGADVLTWSAYQRRVLRLIPRLPYTERLRRLLLDFFVAAPLAQAIQGRPTHVRWHWLPDYRYVCQYRERPVTIHADAVFVWQCATVPVQGDASAAPIATINDEMVFNNWYSAFVLLETGLADMALIRERVRRLLCYRESPERWSCYQTFPPVLVVVEHPHQVECWQRAVREASATLRVAAVHGAIAVFPAANQGRSVNPWRWQWRDLATAASCSLRHFFALREQRALPGGVENHLVTAISLLQGNEASGARLVCSYHEQRSRKMAARHRGTQENCMLKRVLHTSPKSFNAPESVASKRSQRWTPRAIAQVSMILGQRHLALLTLLYRYPLLACNEVAAIAALQDASSARYIRELHALELLCTWTVKKVDSDEQVTRWYPSEQGFRLLAAMHHVPVQRLGDFRRCENASQEDTFSSHKTLMPKGLATLQRYPAHLAGVYSCIAALFHAADTHGAKVAWWEAGEYCTRSYLYHGVQQNLRPDAAFELLFPVQQQEGIIQKRVRYWLEWDNGTMGRRDLEAKFQSYAHYCQSKAWVTDGLRFLPHLLFVVPDTGQETRIASAAMLVQDTGLHVFVTTAGHVRANGLFAAIWRRVMPVTTDAGRQLLP
jgi:hypothetical protein